MKTETKPNELEIDKLLKDVVEKENHIKWLKGIKNDPVWSFSFSEEELNAEETKLWEMYRTLRSPEFVEAQRELAERYIAD